MQTYGVSHALLVQPNSGYGSDNSCMLDTIARGGGRFKGIAIIAFDADLAALRELKAQGIVGAAFNPTFHGIDYYKRSADLIGKLAQLDMFLQIQSEHDQLSMFVPWIEAMPIRVLIDHCGRPTPEAGLDQPGFQALLRLAATQRVSVKLSGYAKFSQVPYPFDDTWPYVAAIVDAFTLDRCLWASDWPYLRAPQKEKKRPPRKKGEKNFTPTRPQPPPDTPHPPAPLVGPGRRPPAKKKKKKKPPPTCGTGGTKKKKKKKRGK